MAHIKSFDLIDTGRHPTLMVLILEAAMTEPHDLAQNTRLVIGHFDDFVNNRDLDAIDRNLDASFVDHDGPGGRVVDRAADRAMMARMHQMFPDLRVAVKDSVAEGDKVVVRNLWTGTNAQTGERVEFHGFVMWRIAAGRIVERWATVTPMHAVTAQALEW